MPERHTIAAIVTSHGKSGVGVVRFSGKKSLSIAKAISKKDIKPRYAHFCTFTDSQNRIIDQGLLIYFNAPKSFTGEDVIEFQAHGSDIVLKLLLKEVLSHGARLARPGEFTERAFLNGKIDLVQAEAVADLIDSVSIQAARSAARSLQGVFSNKIHFLVEELINLRVFVEGALDFPEEEIDFLKNSDISNKLKNLLTELSQLLSNAKAGKKLREGLRVAIVGKPNVGKSSLLNRLVGEDRAIVTNIAGTTRDIIEETVLIDGLTVNLVDTAGLREPEGQVEAEGIKRSLNEINTADIIIYVTDQVLLESDDRKWIVNSKISDEKLIVLHNKIDLNRNKPGEKTLEGIGHIFASMKTGVGTENIMTAIKNFYGAEQNLENIVLARERHIEALKKAKLDIENMRTEFLLTGQGEILAEGLRLSQKTLSKITGEFHTEDLLGEIFSRFCIGK
ncbi:MAG: tRNA uridine-5-carboxymethylaminomethyl(34) synthesis GTPase MnmE [Gammaproteobacteria bacterium]|jgi:tRNA modification GTPase